MALEHSKKLDHSFELPFFTLKNTDSKLFYSDTLLDQKGLLIAFICNHCPYVKGIIHYLVEDTEHLKKIGIKTVAINSNDSVAYPEDSFEKMIEFSKKHRLEFPYLLDETQEVAKKFGAVCTPEFFLFIKKDDKFLLSHKGRLNDFKNSSLLTELSEHKNFQPQRELISIAEYLVGEAKNSMGCSIKWKK